MPRTHPSLASPLALALFLALSPANTAAAQEVPEYQLQACQQAIGGYVEDVRRADEKFRQNPALHQSLSAEGVFDSRESLYRSILTNLILARAQQLYGRAFAGLETYDAYVTVLKQSAPQDLQPVSLWVLSDLRPTLVGNGYSEDEADYLILTVYERTSSYECGGQQF